MRGNTRVTVASFDYDALGHRVRKIDAVAGTTTLYYNDPEWRVLAEYDGSGTLQRTFVWGNYIDEALRMRAGGSDSYYLHDHLYSPAVLIGYESGQWRPVERYEYDAYGTARVINRGPDNAWFTADDVITGSSAINTTLFTGRTLDALDSSALKIMYYRHRYTDPFAGRFLQQDPKIYEDSMNLYQYTLSNPVMNADPQGTDLIAIADRPVIWHGIPLGYHYSVQKWSCCNTNFRALNKITGYTGDQIRKICGNNSFQKEGIELFPNKDWMVWAKFYEDERDGNNWRWKKREVWISEIRYQRTKEIRIMPVTTGTSNEIDSLWNVIKFHAKIYPWAEQEGFTQCQNWTGSLYHASRTNSNTFIRHIMGPLMTEMEGTHRGDFYPSDNSRHFFPYRFVPYTQPWKERSPGQPQPSNYNL